MASSNSATISPTAHYTGYTWFHNGLSHPALVTVQGRVMHAAVQPINALSRWSGGPTLEGVLLARHRAIDELLTRAIDAGRISQVIEVAAGLSPRGWRFKQRYGARLHYIEADLPDMARLKRELLARSNLQQAGHEVIAFDALAASGPLSLDALAATLDHSQGLAIITEGLLMYLNHGDVQGLWTRFAHTLSSFADGVYLSDLHPRQANQGYLMTSFRPVLAAFVRGQVQWHFETAAQAQAALREAGFARAATHHPRDVLPPSALPGCKGVDLVHIIEADVNRARAASA